MQQLNVENKKSFWKRPEGIPGAIVLASIVGAIGYGLYKIMPTIVNLAENMLYLGAMIGVGALAVYIAMDSKVRTLAWYFYKSAIRKATGLFIQLDPVAIIEGFLDDLRDKMRGMEDQIASLKGQIRILKEKIKVKESEVNTFMGMAQAAEKAGMTGKRDVELRKAERTKDAIENYSVLELKMSKLYTVIDKMKSYSGLMIEDISHEIEIKKDERKMIQTSHGVMKSAVNIINGNSDKKMMFDQAMEFIVDDIGMRIGEMERFMDVSSDFIQGVDLENAMYQEKGLQSLEEWSKKADEKFNSYQSPIKSGKATQVKSSPEREKVMLNSNIQFNPDNSTPDSESKYF